MNWKSIVSAILVATTATAQTVHHLPFASRGNTIELAVANVSEMQVVPLDAGASSGIRVRVENIPSWLRFAQEEQTISSLAARAEGLALFSFAVDKSAPVGEERTLQFVTSNSRDERWTKEIRVVVSAPERFELFQNYPNPFNPTTVISYQLPGGGRRHDVSLRVYNLLGQEVATLFQGEQPAGFYQVTWEAKGVASGVYVYQLSASQNNEVKWITRKVMVLIR